MFNAFPSCVAATSEPQQTEARKALGAKVEQAEETTPKKKKHRE